MFHVHRPTRRRHAAASRSRQSNWLGRLRSTGLLALLGLTGSLGSVLPAAPAQQQQPIMPVGGTYPQQSGIPAPVQPGGIPQPIPQPGAPQPFTQTGFPQPAQNPGKAQPFQQPGTGQPIQPAFAPMPARELLLDPALRLVEEAKNVYSKQVETYECTLISQERVNGKLLPEQAMQMSFRKTPFSVCLKWVGPPDKVGQEVFYVDGKNQNRLKAKGAGGLGFFGWSTIDVKDPKVMENSRHTILEAGFGNLIDRFAHCWGAERLLNKTAVQITEYEYNKRRCIRVETIHNMGKEPQFYCYRNVLYFDKETHLPIRMESYDWPRLGGPPDGDLLECFSYANLRFNVKLDEKLFSR